MNKDDVLPILSSLIKTSTHIEAAAVMTRDGMPIASVLDDGIDSKRLSAVSATLLSLSDRALKDLGKGNLLQVLISGKQGYVLMVKVGENAVLSIVSKNDSRLGMVLHEAKNSAIKIAGLISK